MAERRSLFPDDYPAQDYPARRRREHCCEAWADWDASRWLLPEQAWEILHALAHSRIAFSELRLALDADVSFDAAVWMCDQAFEAEWITAPSFQGQERPKGGVGRLWLGRL